MKPWAKVCRQTLPDRAGTLARSARGKRTRFEPVAGNLIGAGGLTWTAPGVNAARLALDGTIRRMILSILSDFGAEQLEHQKRRLGKDTISELAAFRITLFGK